MNAKKASTSVDADQVKRILGNGAVDRFRHGDADIVSAIALLEWNARASAAVFETLGMLELIVRNAMNAALMTWAEAHSAEHWLDLVELDQPMRVTVARAKKTAMAGERKSNPEDLAWHLPFGFWRYLVLPRRHTSLWVPALHGAFPLGNVDLTKRRQETARDLELLVRLRNRVAHHDPIFRRELLLDYEVALRLARSIDPVAGEWIKQASRVPEIVRARPAVEKL